MISNLNPEHMIQCEKADISHWYRGPDFDTMMEGRKGTTVRDLLVELYDKAGHLKQWWLVRHTAGKNHFRKRLFTPNLALAQHCGYHEH